MVQERQPDPNAGKADFNSEDTPIDESTRTTGSDVGSSGKPSAQAETPEGSGEVEIAGSPNQGTEAR